MAGSHVGSKSASMEGSRVGSDESLNSGAKSSVTSSRMAGSRVATALHNNMGLEEVDEDEKGDSSSSTKAVGSLKALIQRHKEELEAIESQCKQEINDCQLQFEAKIQEQQEQQETEVQTCVEEQERQLMELKAIQDKEIQMEESMHDSEMKMLVERRILNSVLQTVADGIINITPIGIIVRFNHAAELMFGYTAQEVIGKNITMLMPERFSRDHHIYLNNYLTTGVKKVIGIGRRVAGLRRNGQEFPLHLSISEMKEDGEHLFTGIARDLTEEVAEENRIAETLLQKQKQLQVLEKKLNSANQDTANLLNEMLPPSISNQVSQGKQIEPQVFPSASVCYLDIVGFSAIAKQVAPLDTLKFLDEVYETINQVVEQYNVYKVETVGDTFVIAAGVPNTNATHASDLATMALHVLQSIDKFRFSMNPDLKVRVRVGINSGPVVAGLVGTKMSRYCLFGDTVTMSSHMTSNGEPGRIHVAEPTYQLLKKDGNFELFKRGKIEVKGRELTTYWVQSKMGFSP
jgi:PAS domain S-box-containing protein